MTVAQDTIDIPKYVVNGPDERVGPCHNRPVVRLVVPEGAHPRHRRVEGVDRYVVHRCADGPQQPLGEARVCSRRTGG